MLANIGLYSYGTALFAYAVLFVYVLLTWRGQPLFPALLAATGTTALWAGVVAGSTLAPEPQVTLMQVFEIVRNAAWTYLLVRLVGTRLQGTGHILDSNRWLKWYIAIFSVILVAVFAPALPGDALSRLEQWHPGIVFTAWLAMAVIVLLLLEQIFRNSTGADRWSFKHLCLGLGALYAYDFFMYAEALLFRRLDPTLWQSRGFVAALAAILLAVAVGRINSNERNRSLVVSRHVVFHSVTLLAAGVYLMLMALAGYFIRYLGGTWGGVLQVAFLCASGFLLLALLFSGKIRARTRVWLSKNFFSYKYDYRVEWLQFTETLASGGEDIPQSVIKAIAHLANSPAGLLWGRLDNGRYELLSSWEMAEPALKNELGTLPEWLGETEWIIDLREWRHSPDVYEKLELPAVMEQAPRAWLIIPLMFGKVLQGILLLRESDLQADINWEDRDLLKVAGRQAASHLAQYQASQALVGARQFEAFNRLSAYVVHDLKNILAQQSLIVSNAEKHRNNPAFVDDVINTVENSVERMTRLMQQMRSGVRGGSNQQVALGELLRETVKQRQSILPVPTLASCARELLVEADREHLSTVFNHIIQNAQEATPRTGKVDVRLLHEADRAIVEVEDTGTGMDETFIRTRLFKPFDSTKGLTGMGIGAFESREFVRNLGGDILVSSKKGVGSLFRIVLPCTERRTDLPAATEGLVH